MLIAFTCPECKAELEAAATASGSHILCPQCSKTLTVPRSVPGPGVTIGQFQIQKLLGKGGMGEVYLARQLSMGRDIALKILPARLRGQKARVQRFFKEVQLLARLDHPNIVMAHEAGEDEDILYLAMSYIPGESLEKRLQQDGPMAELQALQLIDKLASALDYAWREHHLLHRDIKPSNILLTSGGEVKLTDFGLAKCLDDATELTISGDIIGSPNYMSPEQINNCTDLDVRSDMYSLGTTFYHLLTGKLPFAGSSLLETLKKQINESLPDPRIDRAEISEECIILLETMLAKNRKDRHADYPSLRADIARVMAGERPTKGELQPGESILLRQAGARTTHRPNSPGGEFKSPATKKHGRVIKWAAGAGLGLIAVLGLAMLLERGSHQAAEPAPDTATAPVAGTETVTPAPVAPEAASAPPAADAAQDKLRQRYADAMKYMREHPEDFKGAHDLLAALVKDSQGTAWAGRAEAAIGEVEQARKRSVYKTLSALKADVQALLARGNFEGALQRIGRDPGPVAEEITALRAELAQEVTARKQAQEAAQATQAAELAKAKLAALADGLAGDLLKGDTGALAKRIKAAQADTDLRMALNEIGELGRLAQQAALWPGKVAGSFEENRGKSVTVEFKGGRKETLLVAGIAGEKINGQRQVSAGYVGRDFAINELSAGEQLKRVGDDSRAEVKLMRGLVLVRCANDWAAAEKEFAAGGPLGAALIRQAPAMETAAANAAGAATVAGAANAAGADNAAGAKSPGTVSVEQKKPAADEAMERQARLSLLYILKLAGVEEDPANVQAVADTIRRKEFIPHTVGKIHEGLIDFYKNYAQTETAKENAPILNALGSVSRSLPPAQRPFLPRRPRHY